MKKIIAGLTIFLAISILLIPWVSAEGLQKITDRVHAYHGVKNASPGNSFASNAGIVVGQKGVAVVDCLSSAKEARRLLADIKKVTGLPILYVIDTHSHFDHALGNCVLAEAGATVIAHENCRQSMVKAGDGVLKAIKNMGMTDELLEGTTVVYPSLTFKERMEIDLGGVRVVLIFRAPSHSPGNILVYIPEEKVLFTGDILFTDFHPYLGSADLDGWHKNLDHIQTMDVEKIIPGHGPLSTKKDVDDLKEYLTVFDRNARKLCKTNDSLDEVVKRMIEITPARAQGEWMFAANLKMKYFNKK